ncbi:MAG: flagellar hook assembly protein FlgD [Mangrovicoccus sp.]|nr:flagellar hook assembly protein FlgD [Mangrovicoccus sp.]
MAVAAVTSPTGLSSATGTSSETSSSGTDAAKNSALSSDFETFLKMLTTQLQNQDPMNPIDSTDYAVQLATFAGVEQQVLTNDLLKSMGGNSGLGGLAQYSGWVGMEARTEGTIMADGNPVELHYTIPEGTRKAELVVRTASGLELHRIDITGATTPYPWAGTSPGGEPLLKGEYALEIEATDASGDIETVKVSAYGEVAEVRSGTGGTEIVLTNGQTVAPEEITALRGK